MTFYLPIIAGPYSKNQPSDYHPEWWLLSRESIVDNIPQFEPLPKQILEINREAGTCRDVTKEIAKEVSDRLTDKPYSELQDWLECYGFGWTDEYADERSDRDEHSTRYRVYSL